MSPSLSLCENITAFYWRCQYQQALSSQLWTLTININMLSFSRTQGASSQTSISTSHIVPKLLFHDHSQSIKNWKLNKSISTLFSWINWNRYQISMRWLSPHTNPPPPPFFCLFLQYVLGERNHQICSLCWTFPGRQWVLAKPAWRAPPFLQSARNIHVVVNVFLVQ